MTNASFRHILSHSSALIEGPDRDGDLRIEVNPISGVDWVPEKVLLIAVLGHVKERFSEIGLHTQASRAEILAGKVEENL